MKYAVGAGSKLIVKARSSVHDTTTVWSAITGDVEIPFAPPAGGAARSGEAGPFVADPDAIASATATFAVDMTAFDAGDWLKNRKLRKDFALDDHPRATFTLGKVSEVVRAGTTFTARADGTLAWRGKQVVLELTGRGTVDDMEIHATAAFELDIKRLGLAAPRFLMFKVEDTVTVEVVLRGAAVPA